MTTVSTANVEPVMEEALELLDTEIKKEYLEAVDVVPNLVATETSKAKFLRVENDNPYTAARRLALYWKFRKECHGEDRWLRPMTATGRGALGDREVALLRTGIYHYSNTPGYGPVLIVDGSRNKHCTVEALDRVVFYMSTIQEDEEVQTMGVSIVFAVTSDDTESKLGERLGRFSQGLPIKVRRFVVVQNYEVGRESLIEFLAVRRQLQVSHIFHTDCQLIASNKSRGHLLSTVESCGIPRKVLPKACGGCLDEQVLCDWLRERLTVEDSLSINTTSVQVGLPMPANDSTSSNNSSNQLAVRKNGRATGKRKTTVTPQVFQQRIKNLRESNDLIRADNRKLEELLLQARKIALEQQMVAVAGVPFQVSNNHPPTRPTVGPLRPPIGMVPRNTSAVENDNDYLFGVPVADPYEQMFDGDMAPFVQLRRW